VKEEARAEVKEKEVKEVPVEVAQVEGLPKRPRSFLSPWVVEELERFIKKRVATLLKSGDPDSVAHAVELMNALRIIKRGAWKVRRENRYVNFLRECLLGKGGSLKDTQEAMKECARIWKSMPEEKKREYGGKDVAVYDYS